MGHKATYDIVVDNENNELVLTQYALWKDKRLDIYKYNFTKNKRYIRWGNINYCGAGGWLVYYPNEKLSYYYGSGYKAVLYDYQETTERYEGLEYGTLLTSFEKTKELVLEIHPELKYLINKIQFYKYKISIFKLFDLMRMWYEHPSEVESLAYKGFYSLALNKSLYRLGKAKKTEIIRALKDCEDINDRLTLKLVREYINSGLSFNEWYGWKEWNWWYDNDSIEAYRYCMRKNIEHRKYSDMLSMAQIQGHDIEDDYWKYPNDPHAMHERLLETKRELERIAEERQKEQEKEYWNQLVKIAKKNKLDKGVDIGNGYTLFMPYEYEQWKRSADELHQCILASKYYQKMAKGNCLLIMIWHDGKPSSTCEIDFNKNILQHYGNEFNHNNCKPSKYEQEAIKQFLATFKPKKLEFKEVRG